MPGQMVHFEVPAADTAKSREFWGSLFGWEFQEYGEGSNYYMARIDDRSGAAVSGMEGAESGARTYFDVDDINAGAARVKELGGEADEPMPVPAMGWFVMCRDPHGNKFGIWQTDPSAPAPAG